MGDLLSAGEPLGRLESEMQTGTLIETFTTRSFSGAELDAAFEAAERVAATATNPWQACMLVNYVRLMRHDITARLCMPTELLCDSEEGSAMRQAQNREREGGGA